MTQERSQPQQRQNASRLSSMHTCRRLHLLKRSPSNSSCKGTGSYPRRDIVPLGTAPLALSRAALVALQLCSHEHNFLVALQWSDKWKAKHSSHWKTWQGSNTPTTSANSLDEDREPWLKSTSSAPSQIFAIFPGRSHLAPDLAPARLLDISWWDIIKTQKQQLSHMQTDTY